MPIGPGVAPAVAGFRSGHEGGQIPGSHGPVGSPIVPRGFHPLGQRRKSESLQVSELGGDYHLYEVGMGPSDQTLLHAYLNARELRVFTQLLGKALGRS